MSWRKPFPRFSYCKCCLVLLICDWWVCDRWGHLLVSAQHWCNAMMFSSDQLHLSPGKRLAAACLNSKKRWSCLSSCCLRVCKCGALTVFALKHEYKILNLLSQSDPNVKTSSELTLLLVNLTPTSTRPQTSFCITSHLHRRSPAPPQ